MYIYEINGVFETASNFRQICEEVKTAFTNMINGELYSSLRINVGLLSADNYSISHLFNTGVLLYNNSLSRFWPVHIVINELLTLIRIS